MCAGCRYTTYKKELQVSKYWNKINCTCSLPYWQIDRHVPSQKRSKMALLELTTTQLFWVSPVSCSVFSSISEAEGILSSRFLQTKTEHPVRKATKTRKHPNRPGLQKFSHDSCTLQHHCLIVNLAPQQPVHRIFVQVCYHLAKTPSSCHYLQSSKPKKNNLSPLSWLLLNQTKPRYKVNIWCLV